MELLEIKKMAEEFLVEALELDHKPKVISTVKIGDNWEVVAEVFEDSSFIKSLGLKTKVLDQHIYELTIDKKGKVTAYNRRDADE